VNFKFITFVKYKDSIDKKSILFNYSCFVRSGFMLLSASWQSKKVHIKIILGPTNDSFEKRFCLKDFKNRYLCFDGK